MKRLALLCLAPLILATAMHATARESDTIFDGTLQAKSMKTLRFVVKEPFECIVVNVFSPNGQTNHATVQLGSASKSGPIANAPVRIGAEGRGTYNIKVTVTNSAPVRVKANATRKTPARTNRGVTFPAHC